MESNETVYLMGTPPYGLARKCKRPFFYKEQSLYIHPEDAWSFLRSPFFLSVLSFADPKIIKNQQLGEIFGIEVFIQDDIQILLLAMRKAK